MATRSAAPAATAGQRSFDDLGTPLVDVTFCVVDVETTGGSPADCALTEIGAVRLRGGECLGTFQTLVNPGVAIPPSITILTGITEAMVIPAPPIEEVLPAFLEFLGDAVVVGHNVRFDLAFLNAACERTGRGRLTNRSVDTCGLARRLVRDEVPNCKLGTLAERFRLGHKPTHRALDDALATGELLHVLLERVGSIGVTGLDDLLVLPRLDGHAQAPKLRLTERLPREPGVYVFRDRHGRPLYVGKAANLRARVRSYFSSDERRKIAQMLRETEAIDHTVCGSSLEAAVREVRLIHRLQPRFNRQLKTWSKYVYLKLTLDEAFPRLSVVRVARDDGALYLGPLTSTGAARRVAEAIESAVPLRRCTARLRADRTIRDAPCAAAQLGVAACPCAGGIDVDAYRAIVDTAVDGLTRDPEVLLDPLRRRMDALAAVERYEEAADVRDRAAALTHALRRQRRLEALRGAGRLQVAFAGGGGAEIVDGRLARVWRRPRPDGQVSLLDAPPDGVADPAEGDGDGDAGAARRPVIEPAIRREHVDEMLIIASWLERDAHRLRILHADASLASVLPALPSFEPAKPG